MVKSAIQIDYKNDHANSRIRELETRISEFEKQIQDSKRLKESFEERLKFEELLSEISSEYSKMPAIEVDRSIENGLQRIGNFLWADRCSLTMFPRNPDTVHIL